MQRLNLRSPGSETFKKTGEWDFETFDDMGTVLANACGLALVWARHSMIKSKNSIVHRLIGILLSETMEIQIPIHLLHHQKL